MKKGSIIVEQVTKDGLIVNGYDESLSTSEIYDRIAKYFPSIQKSEEDQKILIGKYNGYKYAIRCKNVTYLGNPHPSYKKRIQISDDLHNFYRTALSISAEPILLGIYSYESNTIFVDFKIDTYIDKKAHNSSAHIFVSDLAAATVDGYFQKTDCFGNTITAIRPDTINVLLEEHIDINRKATTENRYGYVSEEKDNSYFDIYDLRNRINNNDDKERKQHIIIEKKHYKNHETESVGASLKVFHNDIIPKIKKFFEEEEKVWKGIDCYKKMIEKDYRNKYQSEWAGFYLEYEFEKYIFDNELQSVITKYQDKKNNGIDLDLYFPTIRAYGDLKAHSVGTGAIQGNDWGTIMNLINGQTESNHVYYIVCEHETEKDSLYDFEVTKFWNSVQKKPDIMSYSKKMKNNVKLKKIYFLDINYSNKEYLTKYKQGLNSNGKPREPKIMIDKDKIQYFLVDQMSLVD